MAVQPISTLELVRTKGDEIDKLLIAMLAKKTISHEDLTELKQNMKGFMVRLEGRILSKDEDIFEYEKMSNDYILMLGKMGSRPTIEALEKSFRFHKVYGQAFEKAFPDFKCEYFPKHYKRSDVWNFVLARDVELRQAATDNECLSVVDAIRHIERCWNFHSKWLHSEGFSHYPYKPVLHGELIRDGYDNAEFPRFYVQSGQRRVAFEYRDTVRVMMKLSERAGHVNPEFVRARHE